MAEHNKSQKKDEKGITVKKEDDFSEWYTQVIEKSQFVDYTSVSGCLAFRPDGYFAWEALMRATDQLFKLAGIQNTYFPLLIPEHLLAKEQEHVQGFTPEVAWVTHTGDSKLDERLAVRPTSETIMYESFSKWVRSWRDLPMRYNQWNSVLRWEFKHPTPLLRSREFLWNEGHSVFATKAEADAERDEILWIEEKVLKEYLALPGIVGKKSDTEKFAGADATYSIEHFLPGGKAIQGPDWHSDGQRFAKAFEIQFINKNGDKEYAYQNTYAISTRELGIMIATHSDDHGLVMPPYLSRIQIVIVPIYNTENKGKVLRSADSLFRTLRPFFRVHVDDNDTYSPGWKFNHWELRGVPVRVEIGERDINEKKVVVVRRDTLQKSNVKMDGSIGKHLTLLLREINDNLYAKAKAFLDSSIHHAKNTGEIKEIVEKKKGIAQGGWCGTSECEAKVKEETGAKITNMPFDMQGKDHLKGKKCVACGKAAKHIANFAKSY